MNSELLQKNIQNQGKLPLYQVIRKPDGRIVRVDIQKAREAMRHAMIIHSFKEKSRRKIITPI